MLKYGPGVSDWIDTTYSHLSTFILLVGIWLDTFEQQVTP